MAGIMHAQLAATVFRCWLAGAVYGRHHAYAWLARQPWLRRTDLGT